MRTSARRCRFANGACRCHAAQRPRRCALVESTGARRIVFLGDFGLQVGVLPAFGSFTGMHPIGRTELDRVFVVADERVVEV